MAHELVSYSFQSPTFPHEQVGNGNRPVPGNCGVVITFEPQHMDFLTSKIEAWFQECDEVIWVDSSYSEKHQQGFIILEWDHCEIPQLFLNILHDEDIIETFSTYLREEIQA